MNKKFFKFSSFSWGSHSIHSAIHSIKQIISVYLFIYSLSIHSLLILFLFYHTHLLNAPISTASNFFSCNTQLSCNKRDRSMLLYSVILAYFDINSLQQTAYYPLATFALLNLFLSIFLSLVNILPRYTDSSTCSVFTFYHLQSLISFSLWESTILVFEALIFRCTLFIISYSLMFPIDCFGFSIQQGSGGIQKYVHVHL